MAKVRKKNVNSRADSAAAGIEKPSIRLNEIILDSAGDGIYGLDLKGNHILVNSAAVNLLGYSAEELMGKHSHPIWHHTRADGSPYPESECNIYKTARDGVARHIDNEVFWRKDGTCVPVDYMTTPIFDGGSIIGTVISFRDIRERKAAEEVLRDNETKFRGIASTARDAIILIDNDGNVSFWNEAASKMFGFTAEEMMGRYLHSFIMPNRHRDRFLKGFENFRKSGKGPYVGTVYEIEAVRKDGTEFPVELSLAAVKLKGKWNAIGIVRDITERKRAEEALKESEAGLARAQEITHLANWERDLRTNRLRGSDELYRIFDLKPGAPLEAFYEKFHPDDRLRVTGAINAAIHEGASYDIEYRIVRRAGEIRHLHAEGGLVRDRDGHPLRFFGTILDITEQKRAEIEMRETLAREQQLRGELQTFIHILSHDLRSPITNIGISANHFLAKYVKNLDERGKEYIGYIKEDANRMEQLIKDLLYYSKIGMQKEPFKEVDCNAVLGTALSNLRADIDQSKAQVITTSCPRIKGDNTLIIQLFQNLIANAIKYTERLPRIEISAEPADNQWLFRFRDNGIGIAPENQEKIFEPFHPVQTEGKPKGTGLGLSICKRIVERHGGRIWVESVPGRGSTFHFTLPKP